MLRPPFMGVEASDPGRSEALDTAQICSGRRGQILPTTGVVRMTLAVPDARFPVSPRPEMPYGISGDVGNDKGLRPRLKTDAPVGG